MNIPLRAFSEMFPGEDAAGEWFEKARWPDGPEWLPLRGGRQRHLHAEDEVLALQGVPKAVQRHCRDADAPDPSATTDVGTGGLPDCVLVEGDLGGEAE